jgi:MFS family permease
MISSFAGRDFRWLMLSIITGTTANWMEIIVRSIIVYDISGSALMLGVVNGAKSVPMLVMGFLGGVLADRLNRKTILVTTQLTSGAIAASLGLLVVTGQIEVWHFLVTSFLEGMVTAVQQPARQALVPSVVPREHLLNAVTLSGSTWNLSRIVGPALAGAAAGLAGPASALFCEASLYLVGSWAIQRVAGLSRPREASAARAGVARAGDAHASDAPGANAGRRGGGHRPARGGDWREAFRGYGYLRENPVVGWLAGLALVPILFSLANQALAPVFAKDVLHMGAGGVGVLLAAPGIGSIAATVLIVSADEVPHKGLVTLIGVVALGVATIIYGMSSSVWLSVGSLVLHGFAMTAYRAVNQTLLQIHTPDEYRGRVMAVWAADRGLHPVSTIAITSMTQIWGPHVAVTISGIGCVLVALSVALLSRPIRQLD